VISTSFSGILLTRSQQAKRQRELEREKEKEAKEARKLEVRCNLRSFPENAALTLSKEKKRLKELEREQREARELKRLEACCVPRLFGQDFILATS